MIYQDSNLTQCSRLYELLEELKNHNEECKRSLEMEKVLRGIKARQKSFASMLRIEAHVTLQEQWINEDMAPFNAWLSREHFPYVFDYQSIPFKEWLVEKVGGQFFAPATIKIRPKKIVETTEEEPRPLVCSVETASMVGLEENVQISEPQFDLENDLSEKCSNDEQGRDIGLAGKTTPVDMIIGDNANMEKSRSAKLFELKAEIMPGEHNNCSTHLAAENEKYFTKSKIFGEIFLFGLGQNQFENVVITRSRLGIKHRWPPPLYSSATFVFFC